MAVTRSQHTRSQNGRAAQNIPNATATIPDSDDWEEPSSETEALAESLPPEQQPTSPTLPSTPSLPIPRRLASPLATPASKRQRTTDDDKTQDPSASSDDPTDESFPPSPSPASTGSLSHFDFDGRGSASKASQVSHTHSALDNEAEDQQSDGSEYLHPEGEDSSDDGTQASVVQSMVNDIETEACQPEDPDRSAFEDETFGESEADQDDEDEDFDTVLDPAHFLAWAEASGQTLTAVTSMDRPSSTLDLDSVESFERKLLQLLTAMAAWCRTVGTLEDFKKLGGKRPMTNHWFEVLLEAEADDVAALGQRVLDAIPTTVKAILGQDQVTVDDLEQLPRLGLDCGDVGCYLSTAGPLAKTNTAGLLTKVDTAGPLTKVDTAGPLAKVDTAGPLAKADAADPLAQADTTGPLANIDTAGPLANDDNQGPSKRVYVGSACSHRKGLAGRMKEHLKVIGRVRSGSWTRKLSRHYAFASQHGVVSQFFVLARIPLSSSPDASSTSFLIEGLMQAFLNVVVKPTDQHNHTSRVASFLDQMRAAVPSKLPSFIDVVSGSTARGVYTRASRAILGTRQDVKILIAWRLLSRERSITGRVQKNAATLVTCIGTGRRRSDLSSWSSLLPCGRMRSGAKTRIVWHLSRKGRGFLRRTQCGGVNFATGTC